MILVLRIILFELVVGICESSCIRTPFRGQHVNGSETLFKPARLCFYPNFPLISEKMSCKISLLVRFQILRLFFNMLMAYHMYPGQNLEKFPQQVKTKLSSEPKTFSEILIAFYKST